MSLGLHRRNCSSGSNLNVQFEWYKTFHAVAGKQLQGYITICPLVLGAYPMYIWTILGIGRLCSLYNVCSLYTVWFSHNHTCTVYT